MKSTRRNFLKLTATAAAAFPAIVPASALGRGALAPSNKVAMGFIGVGSMGGGHVRSFIGRDEVQGVAVCDVREIFRQRAKRWIDERNGDNGAAVYDDFRELLARPDIDAVLIATPEHWHGLIAIEAARNGKAMYCEKPADINFATAQAMRRAVNQYGVVFQFGTQQRSSRDFRFGCELVRNGRIGKLHTIVVGSLPSYYFPNQPVMPVPDKKEFDYDRWLGPARWQPYTYERCASRAMGTDGQWTFISDYSLGGLGGAWGVHHVDIAQWGNNADDTGPLEFEGWGKFPEDGLVDTATHWWVEHTYANGVKMIHTDFRTSVTKFPELENPRLMHQGCGVLFLGSDGWVLVSRGGMDAHPKSLLEEKIGPSEDRLPVSDDHRGNFIECVKTGATTICPVDSAIRSDTICHLDDIAMRLHRKLRWDPEAEQFVGDDVANRMLSRPLRAPWRLEV